MNATEKAIQDTLRKAGRALSFRDILISLGAGRRDARKIRSLLREACKKGLVIKLGRGRYRLCTKARMAQGTVTITRAGHGYVATDRGDVFVHRRNLGGALHGDRLALEIHGDEGVVHSVLDRARKRFLGIFEAQPDSNEGLVRPIDPRVKLDIRCSAKERIDDGTVVEVAVERFPEHGSVASGTILHVIGPADDPATDIPMVCRRFELEERFPDEVEAAAAKAGNRIEPEALSGREDFRDNVCFTIDPDEAKDFDDAIGVVRLEDGGFELAVHIADVSYYVKEGSPLDLEARRRGCSVYFPKLVIPMLPHALSSGLCSLKPGVDRLAMSVVMRFGEDGELVARRFSRSVIRSRARLTYLEAQAILDGDEAERSRHEEIVPSLEAANDLAQILGRRRASRGSIDFDLPEPLLVFHESGEMVDIVPSDQSFTHTIIEEFMLAANEAVSTHLSHKRPQTIYRVHERPSPEKIDELAEKLAAIGIRANLDREAPTPQIIQAVVDSAAGTPLAGVVKRLVLRTMMLARYDVTRLGHFGLALDLYTHFTSPIRRYPDLVVHRQIEEVLYDKPPGERNLEQICTESSARERTALDAEREIIAIKTARFMHERLGEEFRAIITATDRAGIWIELVDHLISGLISIRSLADDFYEVIPGKGMLKGRSRGRTFRPGAKLTVIVDRVDMARHFIDFALPNIRPERRRRKGRPGRHFGR